MALSGNLNIINYEDTGNILTSSFTVPVDVGEDDPYYAQRGTTVERYTSESLAVSSSYNNAYVKIKASNVWVGMEPTLDTGSFHVAITYRVYGSQASRSADISNYLEQHCIETTWDNDVDSNIFTKSYATLKYELGANTLTDV